VCFVILWLSEIVCAIAPVHDAIIHANKFSSAFAIPTHRDSKLRTHGTKLRKSIASIHFRRVFYVISDAELIPQTFSEVFRGVSIKIAIRKGALEILV
tara:strand:+ start:16615 stop:16908 length:294 start_codon:yes stop_codon:yes gene_type:complete